jgi:hypothetical protein
MLSLSARLVVVFFFCGLAMPELLAAQSGSTTGSKKAERWKSLEQSISFTEQQLRKNADDLLWFQLLGETAVVDRIRYAGPPSRIPDKQ